MSIQKEQNLCEILDPNGISCLNEKDEHPLKSILKVSGKTSGGYLESNEDAQLLLNVSFNSKITLLKIKIFTEPEHKEHGPKKISIFSNRPNMGFGGDEIPTQVFEELKDETGNGIVIELKRVKFSRIDSVQILVESNWTDDEFEPTRIDQIDLFGIVAQAATNLSGLRQDEDDG